MKRIFSTEKMIKKILMCAAALLLCAAAAAAGSDGGKQMRQEKIAAEALQNFLDRFFVVSEDGESGEIVGEFFWTRAEMFELAVDAYEKTGDEAYKKLMGQMYKGFVKTFGEDWSNNDFNDDIMWMTIGCARAYILTGEEVYKQQAVRHYRIVLDRALSDELGGGLYWKTDNKCKNACINGPAVISSCLLYRITGEEDYLNTGKEIYDWQEKTLCGQDGSVSDNIETDGTINPWCSTYNQGTMIGAAFLLYQITGEQRYMDRAVLTADYTMNEMYHGGVINTEDEGNDLPGFKGILARWLGKLVTEGNQKQYAEWMLLNAETAWENRNAKGLMWTKWNEKTQDTFYMPWGCSAGVAQQFACLENLVK